MLLDGLILLGGNIARNEDDLKGEALGVTEKGEASWLGGVLFVPDGTFRVLYRNPAMNGWAIFEDEDKGKKTLAAFLEIGAAGLGGETRDMGLMREMPMDANWQGAMRRPKRSICHRALH